MINILFYAVNGLGLGHITRLLAIAREMKKRNTEVYPIFLTSSEASHILYKHGIPYYKVPSKNLCAEAGLKMSDLAMMYHQIATNLVLAYKPAMLIVDTFPIGALSDLVFVLNACPMKKVFVHREQKPEEMNSRRVLMQNFYDLIIAPHQEGSANIPVPDASRLFWAGEILIRDKEEMLSRQEVVKRLGLEAGRKIVYLTQGGGGDGTTESCYEQVMRVLSSRRDLQLVVSKSPFCKAEIPCNGNSKVIDYYPAMELMNGFDAAISAAGYNTFNELMYSGVPTIFIPKERGLDDQQKRALLAKEHKAGFCLSEDEILTKVEPMLDQILSEHESFVSNCRQLGITNGAGITAEKMLSMIGGV